MLVQNLFLCFLTLSTSIVAAVLDVDVISRSSFSISSCNLNVYDSIVYHIREGSAALSVIQVQDSKSCSPVDGGFSFPQTPQNGSVYLNFQNPGTFYITTVEGCPAGQMNTVKVAPPPINPYTIQAKFLIEQINKKTQQSSALSFDKSLLSFAIFIGSIYF